MTNENLVCDYDLAGNAICAAVSWFKNGKPWMDLYMPMEGGASNALQDFSDPNNRIWMQMTGDTDWVAMAMGQWGALRFGSIRKIILISVPAYQLISIPIPKLPGINLQPIPIVGRSMIL